MDIFIIFAGKERLIVNRLRIGMCTLLLPLMAACGEEANEGKTVAVEDSIPRVASENLKMPEDMSEHRPYLHGRYSTVFNDSNRYQYAHAVNMGIDPITDLRSAYFTRRPIVRIVDTEYFIVDSLSHSVPYLVPEAATLLDEIGRNFHDSLVSKNMPLYRLKVTSLLRTPATVKSLRRVNRNATDSSAHKFATTFDISYYGFSDKHQRNSLAVRGLKGVLAEVLYDLRAQNRCMVKHESKSSCFHVTVISK